MARSRVRTRLARKKGGRHAVRKGTKKRSVKKSKASKKHRVESASTKRKPRPPRNGSAKKRGKVPTSQRRQDRYNITTVDELAHEFGLSVLANETVVNANQFEDFEIPDDEPSLDDLLGVPDGEVRGPRSHPGDQDGSN